MNDITKICPACMEDSGGVNVCPHCGFDKSRYVPMPHHLAPGTILNGKYWVGNVIGEGGFGITYVGFDLNLEFKVAIKEYFPNGYVTRDISRTDTITIYTNSDPDFFIKGREKFINEAKALAKFDNVPGIASPKDYFQENGTAYIVMEFVEGDTFKEYIRKRGGRLPASEVFAMMEPMLKVLAQVHKKGIIHRDISPDNILITNDSQVKLLDFGAARDFNAGQKSMSVQLKPGYAPEEQYRSHGIQGPWTDVYGLCATMYKAVTGITPAEALERIHNDTLQAPSRLGIQIDPVREAALMRGMAVLADNRIRSVDELYNAIYRGMAPAEPAQSAAVGQTAPAKPVDKSKNVMLLASLIIAAALVVGAVLVAVTISLTGRDNTEDTAVTVTPAPVIATAEPTAAPVTATEAPTPVPVIATAAPTPEVIVQEEPPIAGRVSLYRSSLTYKRMSGIHNTTACDNATYLELAEVIRSFDDQCENYMNGITSSPPSYLMPGTTAYNQQVGYKQKHPTLYQIYTDISVYDARVGGGYYYVWVSESMSVTESGTSKNTVDHWVYQLKNSGGQWYIVDYTADPAY